MKIASCLFSYNRPHYLAPALKSLEKQTIKTDWFFFQDGPLAPSDEPLITECLDILTKSPLEAHVHLNKTNVCIAEQKLKAHGLFNAYDFVLFFEDDMVVSPFYTSLLLEMHERWPLDVVYAPDRGGQEFSLKTGAVRECWTHFWGYGVGASTGRAMTPFLKEYIEDMRGMHYRYRDHAAIREKWHVSATSHDAILDCALRALGRRKLSMDIPRGRYIGEKGLHSTTEHFRKNGFHLERQYIFPGDATIVASSLEEMA